VTIICDTRRNGTVALHAVFIASTSNRTCPDAKATFDHKAGQPVLVDADLPTAPASGIIVGGTK
jgi:hypothetical protein